VFDRLGAFAASFSLTAAAACRRTHAERGNRNS